MKNIVIFASGNGTNAEAIARHFAGRQDARVRAIVVNRREAGVRDRARRLGIKEVYVPKAVWDNTPHKIVEMLRDYEADLVVLAGFLLKVPDEVLDAYPDKVINIHPALLPLYGGKGMYGDRVHEAVLAAGEKESGITIHIVTNQYDSGPILRQERCPVVAGDTPHSLAERVHVLEHRWLPVVVDECLTKG